MKQKAFTIRFMTSLLIAVCLILSMTAPIPAHAEGTKTVRVGYYENEIFQEGAQEGAVKSGFERKGLIQDGEAVGNGR